MPLRALVALLFLFYRRDLNSFEEKLFSQIEVMSSLSKNHEGIFSSLCLLVLFFTLRSWRQKRKKRKKTFNLLRAHHSLDTTLFFCEETKTYLVSCQSPILFAGSNSSWDLVTHSVCRTQKVFTVDSFLLQASSLSLLQNPIAPKIHREVS